MRKTKYFALEGGLNEVDPPLSLRGGELYGVLNYEPGARGGYRRIGGYERLDGQHAPSEASYWLVNFDAGSTAISAGDEITNVAGAPTSSDMVGEVLADAVVESGTYGGGDAAGYFYITSVSDRVDPDFSDNDTLYVSASSVATASAAASVGGALSDDDDQTYTRAAIEVLRARIDAVPGEGNILGVWLYKGVKYAFRNEVGGAVARMFKSTASGWFQHDLGGTLAFTNGSDAGGDGFTVGETITGGTSLETAVITGITETSGTWTAGNVVGEINFSGVSGVFTPGETITGGTSGTTATAGVEVNVSLLPGGRYEFVNENFYGHSGLVKMYGCDGVNPGFEFDGTIFRQISTGMTTDAPTHLAVHKKHLIYSFLGGSVQNSSIGNPLSWSAVTGASEIATGDEITGFTSLPGDTLGVFNRNRLYILYGTSSANWNLIEHSDESGAIERSIQRIGWPIYADDRGLMDFKAVQEYGDFKNSSFSEKIQKTIDANKERIISSMRVRAKNQYRLFYDNKTFVICSFEDKKLSGFTVCSLPVTAECTASVEDLNGSEVLLFGSTDGYVYQMDKGTSFDGTAVEAFIRIAFNSIGSPERNKKFFKAVFEVDSQEAIDIQFTPDFDYGEKEDITQTLAVAAAGGIWDISEWGSFVWGDQLILNPEAYIDGAGQNIGLTVYSSSIYDHPHTMNSVILHYSTKGVKR